MKTTPGINRRQWLRAAGLTLAGIFVAPRLVQSAMVSVPVNPVTSSGSSPAAAPQEKGPRQYLHGFEAYPV